MDARDATPAAVGVNLLWTGGWDSTFRLLQLLLVHRVPVVPYYLEDPTRASTRTERRAMSRIASRLYAAHPHARELLQPLRVAAVEDMEVEADINDALWEIRQRNYIGDQYAWLAAFCRQQGIADIELGVHVDDKVQALVAPFTQEVAHPAGFRTVRLDPARAGAAESLLFGHFSFPLLDIDKRGIDRAAHDAGWDAVMEMTWFCHSPVRGRPCGLCPPCIYTIEEGLGRRVPRGRRALSFVYRHLARPLKLRLRQMRVQRRATR